eukprot:435789_1
MFISLLLLVLNFNSIKSAALSNELSIVPGTVPPKELPFMIYNRYNNRCVRKLKYGFTKVGIEHIPMDADREECDDDDVRQLWKVKDVDESRRYFKLQNKNLWCLYADSNYNLKLVGCADAKLEAYGNGINAALWKFDAVGANENGDIEFRLKNKLNDCMDMNEGHSWMRSKDCKDNDKDQYFLMKSIEDYELIGLTFQDDNVEDLDITPNIIFETPMNALTSQSDLVESMSFKRGESLQQSWQHTVGISLTYQTKFKAEIPGSISVEVSTSLTGTYEHTWGEVKTSIDETEYSTTTTCNAGYYCIIFRYIATATQDIPYTMKFKSIDTDIAFESYGIWNGVIIWKTTTQKVDFDHVPSNQEVQDLIMLYWH